MILDYLVDPGVERSHPVVLCDGLVEEAEDGGLVEGPALAQAVGLA